MKTTCHVAGWNWFYFFVFAAVVIKFSFFFFILWKVPLNFQEPDSPLYLQGAQSIWSFLIDPQGGLAHNNQAMPGYPLLLAFLLHGLKMTVPMVIFIHVLLNFLAAFIVARIARALNPAWVPLAVLIVLLDLPLTVYSQLIMTEAVFMVALSCFILCFHRYLSQPTYQKLILVALSMVMCVYIRPITCYLAWPVAAFIIIYRCAGVLGRSWTHAVLVVLIFYGACLPWQYRNLQRFGDFRISRIADHTLEKHSFFKDTKRQKEMRGINMPDFVFYPVSFLRNVRELLTTPGNAKPTLSMSWMIFGKVFGYLFVIFWILGFIMGLIKRPQDLRYIFLIWIFLYFLLATVGGVGWTVTSRYRIAMLPSIAILATAGWFYIRSWWRTKGIILWKNRYKLGS